MSDALYPVTKGLMMQKQIDLLTDEVVAVLVSTTLYTYSASHAVLSDIADAAIVATSGTLENKTISANVFDADDLSIASVSGSAVNAVVLVKDTGVASTSPLIAYLDQVTSGLPLTPNGTDVTVTWSNGANRIFAL